MAFEDGKGGAYRLLMRRGGYCRGREDDGRRPVRVLVAEDERLMADAIAVGLRRRAMAVDVCYDGDAALERVMVHRYDVVILDRDLPKVHGDEVCRRIVAAGGETRVLMLTAAAGIRDRVEGSRSGRGRLPRSPPLTRASTTRRQPARHNRPPGMIGVMPDPA
jgi:CheY-like chemotaxis protein